VRRGVFLAVLPGATRRVIATDGPFGLRETLRPGGAPTAAYWSEAMRAVSALMISTASVMSSRWVRWDTMQTRRV
jgi:hypothetical protein